MLAKAPSSVAAYALTTYAHAAALGRTIQECQCSISKKPRNTETAQITHNHKEKVVPPRPKPPSWIPQEMRAKKDRDTPKPIILLLSAILVALVALIVVLTVLVAKTSNEESSVTETTSPTLTATATPSPSATPTTSSPSATPSQNPVSDYTPINTLDWEAVVKDPRPGLRDAIEAHKAATGISWGDVEAMASLRAKNGNMPDARVIVVIDNSRLSRDHQRARRQVDLQDTNVPVIGASRLATIDGRQLSGVQVILAPIERTDSQVGVGFKRFQHGLVFVDGNLIPATLSDPAY